MTTPLDRHSLASVAPTLAAITEQTLFGTIWQRPELSKRERSLITVAALIALGNDQQLPPGTWILPGNMALVMPSWPK